MKNQDKDELLDCPLCHFRCVCSRARKKVGKKLIKSGWITYCMYDGCDWTSKESLTREDAIKLHNTRTPNQTVEKG